MKTTFITILFLVIFIIGAMIFSSNKNDFNEGTNQKQNLEQVNNVSVENEKQIVELTAKGGFYPEKSLAKSDIPTILRIKTSGTFDCSSVLRIPSLNITKNLPQTGITEIDLGTQKQGTLYGTCGMGMYPFQIEFN